MSRKVRQEKSNKNFSFISLILRSYAYHTLAFFRPISSYSVTKSRLFDPSLFRTLWPHHQTSIPFFKIPHAKFSSLMVNIMIIGVTK